MALGLRASTLSFQPKLHNLLLLWTDQGIPDLPQWLTKKSCTNQRDTGEGDSAYSEGCDDSDEILYTDL